MTNSRPEGVPSAAQATAPTLTARDWTDGVIHGKYEPHIDGIRALAVIPVVIYHLVSAMCPGGFAGVDVFFVISGYLITAGILRDLHRGKFTIASFYNRRIRRIVPAYTVLILAVYAAGLILYSYGSTLTLGKTAFSSTLFASNLYFWKYAGYFGPNAHANPLLNLWSLSVEEQFYIFHPLLLLLIWRWRRSWLVPFLCICLLLSLALASGLIAFSRFKDAFYLLPPRAWELLAGALLAAVPPRSWSAGTEKLLGIIGLALVLIPYLAYNDWTPFPGLAAAPSILGTCMLISYGRAGLCGRLLSSAPFVEVGKISYSLYLWHWPIIVFWRHVTYDQTGPVDYLGMAALSLICSWLSWRWVEMPVRRASHWRPAWSFRIVGATSLLLLVISGVTLATDGFREFIHREANRVATDTDWSQTTVVSPRGMTPLVLDDGIKVEMVHLGDAASAPSFLLWGDSHAIATAPGFDQFARNARLAGLFIPRRYALLSGVDLHHTDPTVGVMRSEELEPVFAWLEQNPQIRTVALVSRWAIACEGIGIGIEEPYPRIAYFLAPAGSPPMAGTDNASLFEAGLTETCRRLQALGKQVILFNSIPELTHNSPEFIRRSLMIPTNLDDRVPVADYARRQARVQAILDRIEQQGYGKVFDIQESFRRGDYFVTHDPGIYFYKDDDHLSPSGARFALQWLERNKGLRQFFP